MKNLEKAAIGATLLIASACTNPTADHQTETSQPTTQEKAPKTVTGRTIAGMHMEYPEGTKSLETPNDVTKLCQDLNNAFTCIFANPDAAAFVTPCNNSNAVARVQDTMRASNNFECVSGVQKITAPQIYPKSL